jgi:cytochrome c peroxidase
LLRYLGFLGLIGVLFSSLSGLNELDEGGFQHLMVAPEGFPEIPFPEDNFFSDARWLLGRKLFYDPIMSVDSSISCASCHMAQFAFSDTVAMSLGAGKALGTRNAPTLTNVAYNPYFTRDGGVPTLEMQILVPIQEHNEFNFNILLIAERMLDDSSYVLMSKEAYGRNPDHYVITRALGCFERTLISGNSPYDQFHFQEKKRALNEKEVNGMNLFFSERIGCTNCHSGFNFTDYSFKNNGLYITYQDSGRRRLTDNELDRAMFKVPTLRNVGPTAPYMHDGSIKTLQQVIEHYNVGGLPHKNKSDLIKPLNLDELEKEQLVAFLHTLTDKEFISRKEYKPEGY